MRSNLVLAALVMLFAFAQLGFASPQQNNGAHTLIPMVASYYCAADTSTYGECHNIDSYMATTYYNNYAGSGSFSAVTSKQSALPITSRILQSNAGSGQWLVTCPLAPNMVNTTEYFSSSYNSFIVGNRCLASSQSLPTITALSTSTYWSLHSLASTSINFNIYNIAQAFATALAYSGQAGVQQSNYNISNGYDSNSYIYDGVPSSNQSMLWTWNARYANLSKFGSAIKGGDFYNSKSYSGLEYEDGPFSAVTDNTLWTWYCKYTYNYQYKSDLTLLNNTNITIPVSNVYVPSGSYLLYDGQYNYPVHYYNTYVLGLGFPPENWNYQGTGYLHYTGYYNGGVSVYTDTNEPNTYFASYSCSVNICVVEANATQLNYSYVPALPYLLDNITMPALYSTVSSSMEYLNLSFDMYSTHNYLAPANYLDPLPLYTDSAFFANYSGTLTSFNSSAASLSPSIKSFEPLGNLFLSSLTTETLLSISSIFNNILDRVKPAGNYAYLNVPSPQFIAASPNDYIYVINYTNTCGFACFTSSSNAYLYTFRFIPTGYYNLSNDQPNIVLTSNPPTWSTWNAIWASYWQNALKEQSSNLYLVNVTDLTTSSSTWWGFYNYGVIPTSVTSDYSDDVFYVGDYAWTNSKFFIGALFSNGTKSGTGETQPSGFTPSQEFAVSPGGQELYLANEYYPGSILLYQSPSFSYQGAINMSYSNSTYNMNITSYLAHGGPFDNSAVASAYASAPPVNDMAAYHHPIDIIDQKGLLYVFDLWNFTINGMPSSFLTMRVFSANNTELPINGKNYTTMFPANSEAINTAQGIPPSAEWPPYGWVLSANISTGNGYVSYCAAGCTYTPNSRSLEGTPYPPIGPWISAGGSFTVNPEDLSLSASFNGTFNMVAHMNSWSTSKVYECIDHSTGPRPICLKFGYVTQVTEGPPLYTEFLTFQPKIENYTQLSMGAYTPYSCYISSSQYANGACAYNSIVAKTINNIWPPFLSVPSSFRYVASEGSPEAYLTLTNTLSALFPQQTSSSSSAASANQEASSGLGSNSVSPGSIASGSYNLGSNFFKQPNTYINSNIGGYILIPYNYSYYLYQNIQQTSAEWFDVTNQSIGTPSDTNDNPASCRSIDSTSNVPYSGYTAAQVPIHAIALNETIQGGPTYLQYVAQNLYYIPNESDAGAIMLPYIDYHMSTNRNYGEVFINQTVNVSSGVLSPQLVINASRSYIYEAVSHRQSAFGGKIFPGYMTETALSSPALGADCGSSCPSPYYYAQNIFNGGSRFSYGSSSSANFAQLFDVYQKAAFLSSMILNMSHDTGILGYNRLLFTYVDMFNNTIYMPLDVDFSNITTLSMNVTPIVSTSNSNQTQIDINGTLLSTTPFGIEPVQNAKVYIYYDANINYYNSTTPQSLFSSENLNGYFTHDLQCAFGVANNCTLANPLATITQPGNANTGGASGPYEAGYIGYSPQFNSSGSCPPEPKSLLATGSVAFQCNIYGYNGLQAARYNTTLGYYQYCLPYFANGTGMFTSQLGLAKVVSTNSIGEFNSIITACGTEDTRLIAQYYGNPPPEPIYVNQPSLSFSTPGSGGTKGNALEYNYTTSPSMLVANTQIGNFMLSIGDINIIILLALEASIVMAVLYTMLHRKGARPLRW